MSQYRPGIASHCGLPPHHHPWLLGWAITAPSSSLWALWRVWGNLLQPGSSDLSQQPSWWFPCCSQSATSVFVHGELCSSRCFDWCSLPTASRLTPPEACYRFLDIADELIAEGLVITFAGVHIQVFLSSLGYSRKHCEANCSMLELKLHCLSRFHSSRSTTHFYEFHKPTIADRNLYLYNLVFILHLSQEVPAEVKLTGLIGKWRHTEAPHFTSHHSCEALQGDSGKLLQNRIWPLIRATISSAKCDILMKRKHLGSRELSGALTKRIYLTLTEVNV